MGRLVRLILASERVRFPDSWSAMTRRPKSTLHILPYPIDLLWAKSTKVLSCTPSLEVVPNEVVQKNLLEGLQGIVWAAN
jgi:hypothetical protein